MVQQQAFPVMVSSDIRQAFLQIRVKEHDRDVLRFHWKKEESFPRNLTIHKGFIWFSSITVPSSMCY